MWTPTHAQVVVQRAKSLPAKGRHGNDAYVVIQLGKEKYETSVQKTDPPEWHEECDLSIPDDNTACITLSVYHRNLIGLDKLIGQVQIPLQDFDFYERPKNRWYPLRKKGHSGSNEVKYRGELEARVGFIVKSMTGSLLDLSKKPKKSTPMTMAKSVGGSLMNLASKERKHSLQQPLKSLGHKLGKLGKKSSSKSDLQDNSPQFYRHDMNDMDQDDRSSVVSSVYSEDRDSLTGVPVMRSSQSSLQLTGSEGLSEQRPQERRLSSDLSGRRVRSLGKDLNKEEIRLSSSSLPLPSPRNSLLSNGDSKISKNNSNKLEQVLDGNGRKITPSIPRELLQKYEKMSKEELLELMYGQQLVLEKQMKQIGDLEDYIDNLLVRVMESTPKLLQNPFPLRNIRRF